MKVYLEVIPESVKVIKMDDATYFSEQYRDYISNSKLGLIDPSEGGSPEKFKEGFKGGYNESFELGGAIHSMLLQPDEYHIPDLRKPSGKLGLFAEHFYNYRKEGKSIHQSVQLASESADYYKGKLSIKRLQTAIRESLEFYLGRIKFKEELNKVPLFLSKQMAFKYDKCMTSIAANPKFKETLYPEGLLSNPDVFNEYAILCEVKVTGDIEKTIKVKAKLDNFTVDYENKVITLNDVKSTGRYASYFMGNSITREDGERVWIPGSFEKYHYYRQCGMYLWLLQAAVRSMGIEDIEDYKYKVNILVVETIPEYKTKVCHIAKKWIDKGLSEFKNLLILAANEIR